jgi:hypothetical protein
MLWEEKQAKQPSLLLDKESTRRRGSETRKGGMKRQSHQPKSSHRGVLDPGCQVEEEGRIRGCKGAFTPLAAPGK